MYKQNLEAQSSLNKTSCYSSGKEEMEHKMENPIQIRILVCLSSRTNSMYNNYLWTVRLNDKKRFKLILLRCTLNFL